MMNRSSTRPSIQDHEGNTASLDPREFCRLLLSRRHLERVSRPNDRVNVVFDPASGERYQVEAALLDRYIDSLAS